MIIINEFALITLQSSLKSTVISQLIFEISIVELFKPKFATRK